MGKFQKKICLIGEFSVGKTSLVRRFIEGRFEEKYLSTIGVQVSRKSLQVRHAEQQIELDLLVWDLVGGEKFDSRMKTYFRGASGAILVCDLTRPETLVSLARYATDFWQVNPATPLIMVGNKADLIEECLISDRMLAEVAADWHAPWFLSSAKSGENVELIFQTLGEQMMHTQVAGETDQSP